MPFDATEHEMTVAVQAAARDHYEREIRSAPRLSGPLPAWEDVRIDHRRTYAEHVMPLVLAALEALPDRSHDAWDRGYVAAFRDAQHKRLGTSRATPNPHPMELT